MNVIYKGYSANEVKPFTTWNSEVKDAVKKAIELIEGKKGFKTFFESWSKCELIITVGHNIYTTSIEIRPLESIMLNRKKAYHNGYAYYCNGHFWANISQEKVNLI